MSSLFFLFSLCKPGNRGVVSSVEVCEGTYDNVCNAQHLGARVSDFDGDCDVQVYSSRNSLITLSTSPLHTSNISGLPLCLGYYYDIFIIERFPTTSIYEAYTVHAVRYNLQRLGVMCE